MERRGVSSGSKGIVMEFDDLSDFMSMTGIKPQRSVPDISKPWMKYHEFVLVRSVEQVREIVDKCIEAKKCSLDLETEGLDNRIRYVNGKPETVHKIVGYCISYDGKTGYYIPVRHKPEDGEEDLNLPAEEVEAEITRLCKAAQPEPFEGETDLSFRKFKTPPRVVIYFWNAKYDQEMLYPVTGIDWWHPESFEDGYLAGFVIYTGDKGLGLKPKAKQKLKDPEGNPYEMIELKELFVKGRKIQFDKLSPDEPGVIRYACSDAICTYLLCEQPDFIPLAHQKYAFTYRLEKMVVQVIRVMERNRVKISREKIRVMLEANLAKLEEVEQRIKKLAAAKGFHDLEVRSLPQLGEFLFGEKGLDISPKPPRSEKSGQYQTGADVFEELVKENPNAPDVLKWVLEFREYDKLHGTYLKNLYENPDENDELRFGFKQTGAETGRFSAPAGKPEDGYSGVFIHGIPATSGMRDSFESRDEYIIVQCDYSGQELRIAANNSGEPVWINEFLHGSGDLHTITAKAFFNTDKPTKEQRGKAKAANFALVYGGGPSAIVRATGCDKMEGARRKAAFDKSVPTFAKWVKTQHAKVKKDRGIWNAFGRWIAIPDANIQPGQIPANGKRPLDEEEAKKVRAACERYSTNYPTQSAGADIMKIALVLLHKEFHKRGWLRSSGDDSVRMLLTVHDEIVFEIRKDRVQEAIPVIVKIMASPANIPKPPFAPKWQVPLVVEPMIGLSWDAQIPWEMVAHGKPYDGGEIPENHEVIGDRLYHKVPEWLQGHVHREVEGEPAPTATSAPQPKGVRKEKEVQAPSAPQPTPAPSIKVPEEGRVVVFRIPTLTRESVRAVRVACASAVDPDRGKTLKLLDVFGSVLIDSSKGVRVDPKEFARVLRERNLGNGKFVVET